MKALVMAPSFFGYDKAIVKGLEDRGYSVDFLDSEQLKPEYWSLWNKSFLSKAARHIIPGMRDRDRKKADIVFSDAYLQKYIDQIDSSPDAYSLVLTVKGDFIQDSFYSFLRKTDPKARYILYLWDDVRLLHRRDYFDLFDEVYSFNLLDCQKYGWKYLPVFAQDYRRNADVEKKYDIAIIGTGHKERVRFARKIYEKYKDEYSFFIYLVKKEGYESDFFAKENSLSYDEYMQILQISKCVLDDPLRSQRGPTTRVFDAMGCGTKILTTNRYISYYPVNKEYVKIISRSHPVIDRGFVESPVVERDKTVMDISEWLKKMINTK